MKTVPTLIVFGLMFLLGQLAIVAAPDQPHMRAAIELLQSAKQSDNPLPMLRAARKHVVNAQKNKAGERKDAIAAINEAIASATVGDKEKTEQKINHAISQIHSGMGKAK